MERESFEIFNIFKFCPECGAREIYKKSDNAIECSSCHFKYYINAAGAVAGMIFDNSGRLLLTVRGRDPQKGFLDLPGGFIDIGESAEEALKREIKEELDSEISNIEYIESHPNIYPYGRIVYHTLDIFFKCNIEKISLIAPGDDIADVIFLKPDDIDVSKIAFNSVEKVLQKNLNIIKI